MSDRSGLPASYDEDISREPEPEAVPAPGTPCPDGCLLEWPSRRLPPYRENEERNGNG